MLCGVAVAFSCSVSPVTSNALSGETEMDLSCAAPSPVGGSVGEDGDGVRSVQDSASMNAASAPARQTRERIERLPLLHCRRAASSGTDRAYVGRATGVT